MKKSVLPTITSKSNDNSLGMIHGFLLLLGLCFLFDVFDPTVTSNLSILEMELGGANDGGLNKRSLFWVVFAGIVLYLHATNIVLLKFRLLKTYFLWVTLLIVASVLWSEFRSVSIVRAILWVLSGGSILLLYSSCYRLGILKQTFLILSFTLLTVNLAFIVLFPVGTFSSGGSLTGIFTSKNSMGATAGLFVVFVAGFLAQYQITDRKLKVAIILSLIIWAIMLFMSESKTSLAFAVMIAASLFIAKRKTVYTAIVLLLTVFLLLVLFPLMFKLFGYDIFLMYSDALPPEIFTGRGLIWGYIFEEFHSYFWFGVGYGSYWATGEVREIFDVQYSFLQVLNSSHNGYIHVFTNFGLLGLTFFLGLSIVKIIKNYKKLELWECGIIVFIIFHALMESDFFMYKNLWIVFVVVLSRPEIFEKPRA